MGQKKSANQILAAQFQLRLLVQFAGINSSGTACETFLGTCTIDPETGEKKKSNKFHRAFHGQSALQQASYDQIMEHAVGLGLPRVYEHVLWKLLDERNRATMTDFQAPAIYGHRTHSTNITAIRQLIFENCQSDNLCLNDKRARKATVIKAFANNNELDVLASFISLLRLHPSFSVQAFSRVYECYLQYFEFAVEWRYLACIKEEFFYLVRDQIFADTNNNADFIERSLSHTYGQIPFDTLLTESDTRKQLHQYFVRVCEKQSSRAKHLLRVALYFVQINELLMDLDYLHGAHGSENLLNESGLLALLTFSKNAITVNACAGKITQHYKSTSLKSGKLLH